MHNINQTLFYFFNHGAGVYPWLDHVMVFITRYGLQILGLLWVFFMTVHFFQLTDRGMRVRLLLRSLRSVVSLALVAGSIVLIKTLVAAPRPFVTLSGVHQLVTESPYTSFPSQHAAIAFAIAYLMYRSHKKLGLYFFVLAMLIGVSRVFVGVHYPVDVLAGGAIAVILMAIFHKIISKKVKKLPA